MSAICHIISHIITAKNFTIRALLLSNHYTNTPATKLYSTQEDPLKELCTQICYTARLIPNIGSQREEQPVRSHYVVKALGSGAPHTGVGFKEKRCSLCVCRETIFHKKRGGVSC